MQAERWLVNLIPNSETMSLSGKQSDVRKRWFVKLLKIRSIDSLFIKTASQPKAELRNYLQKLYNT